VAEGAEDGKLVGIIVLMSTFLFFSFLFFLLVSGVFLVLLLLFLYVFLGQPNESDAFSVSASK
jgi:hypothetical protein